MVWNKAFGTITTAALSQVGNNSQGSIEEEARRLASADVSRNGVPRKVSDVYNLIKVEAIAICFDNICANRFVSRAKKDGSAQEFADLDALIAGGWVVD